MRQYRHIVLSGQGIVHLDTLDLPIRKEAGCGAKKYFRSVWGKQGKGQGRLCGYSAQLPVGTQGLLSYWRTIPQAA
jgi:hypothetical protein